VAANVKSERRALYNAAPEKGSATRHARLDFFTVAIYNYGQIHTSTAMPFLLFLKRLFPHDTSGAATQRDAYNHGDAVPPVSPALFRDQEHERIEENMRVINEDSAVKRSHKSAAREVREAAERSLKHLHILQRGRCPQCGDPLRQHLFISVCDSCGWASWSTPKKNGVKVHLVQGGDPVTGDAAYVVKNGVTVVRRGEFVFARLPHGAVSWIEYVWTEAEMRERERGMRERLIIDCGWCGKETDPESDGFHLVQVAFGTTQERYCLCSDECYEAFRKMYPSRIHRDCYDRDCDDCDLCLKRYQSESTGIRTLPKDFLKVNSGSSRK